MGKNNTGDINLWGHKSPNLEEALQKRDEDLSLVAKIEANIDDNSQNEGIKLLLSWPENQGILFFSYF